MRTPGDRGQLTAAGSDAAKKWIIAGDGAAERDARRTRRFALLIPDARLPALTEKQQAILAELAANGGEMLLAELRRRDLPSSTLQTLVKRGLVRIEERPAAFHLGGLKPASAPFELNAAQSRALTPIVDALGAFHPFLLHGVTGSGRRLYTSPRAAGTRSRVGFDLIGS